MSNSDAIATFYDTHPYPPAIDDLDRGLRGWDEASRRVEHSRRWPTLPYRDDRSILIAGCGTSQAARWAARYPQASVVGIDVSPASLDAEHRLVDRHQLDNLELRELPIEEASTLGTEFDEIVCTGVLHHLADPALGLRRLREVLAPAGALQLMVYGTYGRFGVSMLRELNRRLGVAPTLDGLDDLARMLKELPVGHPMSHLLREAPDFNDRDALADALLNPRERSYTVPELFDLLTDAGLRFGRWVRQAPYRPQCGAMRDLPQGSRLAGMADSDQYAAMELFRGTMARHDLIAYRDDAPLPAVPVDWTSDSRAEYVPMIPATVVVVEEGLPPGMAAALINRAHIDRDLVCFLTSDELECFRVIDGGTPISAIGEPTPRFMERLWMHDLVLIHAFPR